MQAISRYGVTITRGNLNGDGGGIYVNDGSLAVTRSALTANAASVPGGVTCCFSSGGYGAAIYAINSTTVLTSSTVNGNRAAGNGGGIYSRNGTLTLVNSTVSSNTAIGYAENAFLEPFNGYGGGIYLRDGTMSLSNVTVAYNTARGGLGIRNDGGVANLDNTIVARNVNSTLPFPNDFWGAIASTSTFNLLGNGFNMTGIANGTNGNQVGADARLDPVLALNGGSTPNHALLAGSPAIDGGNSTRTPDQRGRPRPYDNPAITNAEGGNGADIGAFEAQLALSTPPAAAIPTLSEWSLLLVAAAMATAGFVSLRR
jgi:predicted outer membrane repeat protein